ncbi:hypothetical protein G9X52_00910 [Cronobacter sakazakii]|uniref:hypothetical protein n=1 Tax=Cronobacter sakazakii TaxID=28141 RepID=UPI000BE7EF65|nr:hypothetical protein [Cronobacter sakazakii]ELQ6274729.1 hypothetical protein [Cronobacter sakazakii]ELY6201640.1 hypothetical protein [Cronobacter sakazakii]NCH92773.1 hypothetical protein [Cronobacter sakazakii]NHV91981.1 hypothetical protein [Cronobacter sakazakii]PQV66020.1 hypothetical protein CDT97_19375 [Cronobacter sakazakii]
MNNKNKNLTILEPLIFKKFSSKENFIGLITIVIYSREIFLKNEDAAHFIKQVFGITFLDYVIKSRTLLCARLTRNIVNMNDKDIKDAIYKASYYFKTEEYIMEYNNKLNTFNKNGKKSKNNASRDVGTWINALLKKDKK